MLSESEVTIIIQCFPVILMHKYYCNNKIFIILSPIHLLALSISRFIRCITVVSVKDEYIFFVAYVIATDGYISICCGL